MGWSMGGKLQRAIGQRFREGFLFGRVELAILVEVECRDLRIGCGKVLDQQCRIPVMECATMGLCDGQPAYSEADHGR